MNPGIGGFYNWGVFGDLRGGWAKDGFVIRFRVINEGLAADRILSHRTRKLFEVGGKRSASRRPLAIDLLCELPKRVHRAQVRLHQPLTGRAAEHAKSKYGHHHHRYGGCDGSPQVPTHPHSSLPRCLSAAIPGNTKTLRPRSAAPRTSSPQNARSIHPARSTSRTESSRRPPRRPRSAARYNSATLVPWTPASPDEAARTAKCSACANCRPGT